MTANLTYKIFLLMLLFSIMGCEHGEKKLELNKDRNSAHAGYRTISEGNKTREYILHIPSSYDKSPTPLVINFHGFGDSAADYAKDIGEFYKLNTFADTNNFILAYPQAVMREKEGVYWDPGDDGSKNIYDNDVYFTVKLISDINRDYNIDLSRVYAIGYSNGGMMAYGLACTKGELIAAVGIMSGIMLEGKCDDNQYTPIIHFHGTADDVILLNDNNDFNSVTHSINFWLNHNKIPKSSLVSTELNNGDVIKNEYTGGNKNTSVVHYVIKREHDKPGGHVWFSDDIDGKNPNQIMWDFLSRFSLRKSGYNNL